MVDCSVDSTALIDVLRQEGSINSILLQFSEIGISHIALGEILLGVLKSNNPSELDKTYFLVEGMTLLHGDEETAAIYAHIRKGLEENGKIFLKTTVGARRPRFRPTSR